MIEQVVARIFPSSRDLFIEHMQEGVSTHVYRIRRTNEIFYLRVLPEIAASFAPEIHVHQILRERQVKVPEVIYFEQYNQLLQRSIMVTTEIQGEHVGHCSQEQDIRAILIEAGRDLAVINSIPVQGFGWIKRDSAQITSLVAEHPSLRAFVYEYLENDLAFLSKYVLSKNEVVKLRQIVELFDCMFADELAWLAHGDLDVTHIYQKQGRYTGIIDFGEIRGAPSLYDPGHFHMHDGERLSSPGLPYLLEGYREVTPLPPNYEQRIIVWSLLIATRSLARSLEKRPYNQYCDYCLQSIRKDLSLLLV